MIQEKLHMNDATLVSYNKVTKLNPDARDAFIAKSRIYEANGNFNLAIKEYEKIYFCLSGQYVCTYISGECYYKTRNYIKAEEIFLKIKKYFPPIL
jgi:tetratricopeptide (TPR) repeat protein